MIHSAKQPVFTRGNFPAKKLGGNSICQQDFPFLSRIFHFWARSSIFCCTAPPSSHWPQWTSTILDGWCTDGISFSVPVLTKVVDLYFLTLSQPWSQFLFWNFSFSPHLPFRFFFWSFWNFPATYLLSLTYPTHPHLPTHLYI